MFRTLRDLRAQAYDHVEGFRRLPELPESSRMTHHRTCEGAPNRHRRITPRLVLRAVNYLHATLQGDDHADPH